jgi:hypothetical protein
MINMPKKKLPTQLNLPVIDIYDCEEINTVSKVPEGMTGYAQFYQGKSCNAKLGASTIKKQEMNTIQEARLFCNKVFNPRKQLSAKNKEAFIDTFGKNKGEYFYEHEFLSFEGKKDKESDDCMVAIKAQFSDGSVEQNIYRSNKIFLRKNKTD